jgi:carboxypeptidase family protein
MTKAVWTLILGLLLAFCPPASWGQAVFGSIAGTVTDSAGAALPGAKITITDANKGVGYNNVTNSSGNYAQSHLIVGTYDVRIESPGFDAFVQKNAHVEVDAITQVSAQLTLGKVGEVVNVTGEEPLLSFFLAWEAVTRTRLSAAVS